MRFRDIKYPTIGEETGSVPDSTSTENIRRWRRAPGIFCEFNIDAQTSGSGDVIYTTFYRMISPCSGLDGAQLREESVSIL